VSFILDALRKSEHARQHLGGATLAELPLGRRPRSLPWWVPALAALLVVNLIVLAVVLMRNDRSTTSSATAPTAAPVVQPAPTAPTPTLAEEAAPPVEYETIAREESPLAADVASDSIEPRLVKPIEAPVTTTNGELPELRLDMHVYANSPKDRMVYINMRKYLEGETLAEGPRITEITPNGVTLLHRGSELHLPRP